MINEKKMYCSTTIFLRIEPIFLLFLRYGFMSYCQNMIDFKAAHTTESAMVYSSNKGSRKKVIF